MTAQIIHLDAYRPIPSLQRQREARDEVLRMKIMEIFIHEPALYISIACTAASDALKNGSSFETALELAAQTIESLHIRGPKYE